MERETECKELRITVSELEANMNDLHTKFEAALAHLEEEADNIGEKPLITRESAEGREVGWERKSENGALQLNLGR